jgi:hypothetical protein
MLKNVTNNQTPFDIGVSIPGKVIPPAKVATFYSKTSSWAQFLITGLACEQDPALSAASLHQILFEKNIMDQEAFVRNFLAFGPKMSCFLILKSIDAFPLQGPSPCDDFPRDATTAEPDCS